MKEFLFLLFLTAIPAPNICLADSIVKAKIIEKNLDPSTPLFFYENQRIENGNTIISKTKYTDKSGTLLVEEESIYEEGKLLRYLYKQNQVNEFGSIEARDGKMHFSFTSKGKVEKDKEDIEPNMIVADQISRHIQENWNALAKGETIKFRFLLVERQETIGFKFFVDKERVLDGVRVVDIIMKPTSIIIAALTSPLRFTVEKAAPHRIIETFGRLPIRITSVANPGRNDWHAIDALMNFEYPAPQEIIVKEKKKKRKHY